MSEPVLHFIDEANVVYTILITGVSERAFFAIAGGGQNFEDFVLINEKQAQFRVGGVLYVWDIFVGGEIELSVSSNSVAILRRSLLHLMEAVRAHAPDCAFVFHFDVDYQHEIGRV